MSIVSRLLGSLLAAIVGFGIGFGLVALLFFSVQLDPGIGGGLIALLAGIIGGITTACWTFVRLGQK
jgi:hypothetical protein